MNGVFEIREYLDERGQTKNNEMVDITAELERFAKMGGDVLEKQEALDEEKQFIRELADMVEKTEESRKKALEAKRKNTSANVDVAAETKDADELDDVLEKIYQASIEKSNNAGASAATKPKTAAKSSGGWKSGFLSSSTAKPAKKQTSTVTTSSSTVTPDTSGSSTKAVIDKSVDPVSPSTASQTKTAQPNIDDSSKKRVVFNQEVSEQSPSRLEATAPLKEAPTPEVFIPEEPRENVFSQQKHMYQRPNPMAATGGIKALPKIPKGETTKVAFTGTISERS